MGTARYLQALSLSLEIAFQSQLLLLTGFYEGLPPFSVDVRKVAA